MERTARNLDTFSILQDTNSVLAKEGVVSILWANPSLLSSYTILYHFNDSISLASMGKILAIDTSMMSFTTLPSSYSTLLSTLMSITPANHIEANLQTAASMHLSLLINDTLTSTQLPILRALANECPDWGGTAVYEARALLANYDSAGTIYNDSCYAGGHRAGKRVNSANAISGIQNVAFNLYPNPNNGGFTLSYQLQAGQTGEFTMYTMLGEKVASYTLDANTNKMNIVTNSSLSEGIYLYYITVNNNIVKRDKVVIVK